MKQIKVTPRPRARVRLSVKAISWPEWYVLASSRIRVTYVDGVAASFNDFISAREETPAPNETIRMRLIGGLSLLAVGSGGHIWRTRPQNLPSCSPPTGINAIKTDVNIFFLGWKFTTGFDSHAPPSRLIARRNVRFDPGCKRKKGDGSPGPRLMYEGTP